METAINSFNLSNLMGQLPQSLGPIFITLILSFLIGLEREEHSLGGFYNFGGVRTFPIIGLCGYLLARLSEGQPSLLAIGVLILGSLLWLSYRKKLELSSSAGITSEISGLFTLLLGALCFHGDLWEATALAVIVLLLLELKTDLESLAKKIPPTEVFTFTRFLLISAVILPIVPNHDFTDLHLNPFHTWLIVVVICGISYGAYVIENFVDSRKSLLAAAVLGGIYSSTSATIVLSKRSRDEKPSHLFSGAILIASGFMYFRLIVLLGIFNQNLFKNLFWPFVVLGLIASIGGSLWMILTKPEEPTHKAVKFNARNPLELQAALIFALVFSLMGVLTAVTLKYLGSQGIFSLSFLTGLTDVDPYIMSLTQSSGTVLTEDIATKGILIATASNNIIKGVYAAALGTDGVRKQGSTALITLGLISLLTLLVI
ncbi:MAG: MgtC/SapB family protein [Pseudobdellovibrionaceae bacterium]